MEEQRRTRRGFIVSPSGRRIDVVFREIADPDVWVADVPPLEAGPWRIYFDNDVIDYGRLATAYDQRPKVEDRGGGLPGEKTPL